MTEQLGLPGVAQATEQSVRRVHDEAPAEPRREHTCCGDCYRLGSGCPRLDGEAT